MNIVQIYKDFPTQQNCIEHLEKVRWNNKPSCPYCKSLKQTKMPKENRYHCNTCNTSYSVMVGTIFENTKLDFQKWFLAISLVLNDKKGVSSRALARHVHVNKNTGLFIQQRLRRAMIEYGGLLEGIIEVDETLIGGKNKNRHNDKKIEGGQGGHSEDKTAVFGMLERGGKIRAMKVKNRQGKTLKPIINKYVSKEATIMTDEHTGYSGLSKLFKHKSVNHGAGRYVIGEAHTNTIENFWSLLKRGIIGQYHHITAKYLNEYVAEFCFRYSNRNNPKIFELTLQKALGV